MEGVKNKKKGKNKTSNNSNACVRTYRAIETFCLSPPDSLAPLSPTDVCRPLGSFSIVSSRLHLSSAEAMSAEVVLTLPYLRWKGVEEERIVRIEGSTGISR